MVKKITGSPPTRPASATTGVKENQAITGTQLNGVQGVNGATRTVGAGRTRQVTRPMTAEERNHLFSLINEEADKLFGQNGLPASRRRAVTESVRIAIEGGAIEEDEEQQ